MPPGLGVQAKRKWNEVIPELERMGLLSGIDGGALEVYCRLYEEMHNHKGGRGFSSVAQAFITVGSRLGLDPMARQRMEDPRDGPGGEADNVFGSR